MLKKFQKKQNRFRNQENYNPKLPLLMKHVPLQHRDFLLLRKLIKNFSKYIFWTKERQEMLLLWVWNVRVEQKKGKTPLKTEREREQGKHWDKEDVWSQLGKWEEWGVKNWLYIGVVWGCHPYGALPAWRLACVNATVAENRSLPSVWKHFFEFYWGNLMTWQDSDMGPFTAEGLLLYGEFVLFVVTIWPEFELTKAPLRRFTSSEVPIKYDWVFAWNKRKYF